MLNKEILATRFELDEFEKMKRELVRYECGLSVMMTQLNNLNAYFTNFAPVNPIDHINFRIKSPESIAGKLKKKGYSITAEAAVEHLKDIAGIRIICSYAKNIYEIAEFIKSQDNVTVIKEKDYIQDPKESGYRSYHMIVEVNSYAPFEEQSCPVEIQIRTSAMDFWATLEHKVRYKFGGNMPEHLSAELQNCAERSNDLDERMYLIHELVELINEDQENIEEDE